MAHTLAALLRRLDSVAPYPATDTALLHNYATTGDRDALAALVHRHGPVVYRVCKRMLRPDDVEDGFQATFLVLARRAGSVKKAGSVGSWLVGVAGRVAREVRRAERRRGRREVLLVGEVAGGVDADPGGLERVEHARILHEELCRLPDRLRGPLVACLLQGRTSEEAAVELGASPRTVRRRVEQAKRVLRARLERRGVVPAVAAALVAAPGGSAAVPTELVHRTVGVLNDFLAGGTSPPAVLAQGVVKAMTPRKVLALVVVAAACLTVLGAGLAGGDPPLRTKAPPDAPLPAAPPEVAARDATLVPTRPGPGVERALAGETEHLRFHQSQYWAGAPRGGRWKLSVTILGAADETAPPAANELRVVYRPGGPPSSTTDLELKGRHATGARVTVTGSLEDVLDRLLARELHRVVLAEHLGQRLPWWLDVALNPLGDHSQMAAADRRCRAGLAAGKCLRLSELLSTSEAPADAEVATAQAFMVLKYLRTEVKVRGEKLEPGLRERTFVTFLDQGLRQGWNYAARQYEFGDADALQTAWLRWMDSPASVVRPAAQPEAPRPAPPPPGTISPNIPPTRVRDQ